MADIGEAVRFAPELGLLVSVRGGSHSAPGYGTNGGMVIDLSPMKGIRADPLTHVLGYQLSADRDQEPSFQDSTGLELSRWAPRGHATPALPG